MNRPSLAFTTCALLFLSFNAFAEGANSTTNALLAIARDVARLGDTYPQLKAFSVTNHLEMSELRISYAFNTHKPHREGGWTSGVPNPDKDGIWFYIDFHDPKSKTEIHTQPATLRRQFFADKAVTFLILEGPETKSVEGEIWKILYHHGVTTNQPSIH